MASSFPLHIDLSGNNCTIFGGSESAARRAALLLEFGAKVTVISASVCPTLQDMSDRGAIRHIPRGYFRGDCSNAQICVAACDDSNLNIRIASECKAKGVPVNVTSPADYGNFEFPRVVQQEDILLSITGDASAEKKQFIRDKLDALLPALLQEWNDR